MATGNPKSFRPMVSRLEDREVPTISTIQLSGTVLTVLGANDPSNIAVIQDSQHVLVQDSVNNTTRVFARSQVSQVDVIGGSLNDSINSTGNAGVLVRLFGGPGDDTLSGDGGANFLAGGKGNDIIKGNGGSDTVGGGKGNDFVSGGAGNDILNGGDGNDTVVGGNGSDAITGGIGDDVLIGTDGAIRDTIDAGSGTDTAWVDQINGLTEGVTGLDSLDFVRPVAAYANGAPLTLNPGPIPSPALLFLDDAYEAFDDRPLFSTNGPQITDINSSGLLLDDPLLASLGAMLETFPNLITTNVVDFSDGTYAVRLNGTFYRVDNQLPTFFAGYVTPEYAGVGAQNSLWVAIIEKVFATRANITNPDYALIDDKLTASEVFQAFGATTTTVNFPGTFSFAAQLGTVLKNAFVANKAMVVTLTSGGSFTITDLTYDNKGAVSTVTLRDALGSGGVQDDGFFTISIDTLFASPGVLTIADFSNV